MRATTNKKLSFLKTDKVKKYGKDYLIAYGGYPHHVTPEMRAEAKQRIEQQEKKEKMEKNQANETKMI